MVGSSGEGRPWYRKACAGRRPVRRTKKIGWHVRRRPFMRYMHRVAARIVAATFVDCRRGLHECRRLRSAGGSTIHSFGREHMIIKRIGVLKAATVQACIMGLFGLVFGLCFLLFGTLFGSMMGSISDNPAAGAGFGMLGGIGMVILLPIMYGVMGFVAGAIGAAIYNLVAGWVGGIELEVE
jgi:hypothetical protein